MLVRKKKSGNLLNAPRIYIYIYRSIDNLSVESLKKDIFNHRNLLFGPSENKPIKKWEKITEIAEVR